MFLDIGRNGRKVELFVLLLPFVGRPEEDYALWKTYFAVLPITSKRGRLPYRVVQGSKNMKIKVIILIMVLTLVNTNYFKFYEH